MPTYDYKCEQCGDRFEYFQSMTSERLTTCSKCGGPLRRLIGEGAGIIFKGTGFYCTDYKARQNPPAEHEKKASESSAPKTGESTKTPAAASAS